MSKKRPVSEEDAALFRNAAGDVRVIEDDRVSAHRNRPTPRPKSTARTSTPDVSEDKSANSIRAPERDGEQLFVRPGLQQKQVRRLRRGQIPIAAEADLHGTRIHEARELLEEFLRDCRAEGLRCVRVIHGKGLGSRDGHAVLKWEVDSWLRRHEGVMAFCTAQPRDGGTGAVYVLLKG
ncbi:MAG: Smr/MutS family protein [Gammaproteobacteria bacterium]